MPFVQVDIDKEIENKLIGEMKKKESNPSLKIFCRMLNALGYELQIVKKQNI